jgi:hypothetical protein
MPVHVLLFDAGSDAEGIHSLEVNGKTLVLLFEDPDDAERYAGLLEAQDFPMPSVEAIDREEIELFCSQAGYQAQYVPAGFLPQSAEDRLLIAPPERNMDVSNWKEELQGLQSQEGLGSTTIGDPDGSDSGSTEAAGANAELEAFRRRLEGLL